MADVPAIAGVVPVLEVPFHADERLDLYGFERVIDGQVGARVDGVMFPGFASEFHKLTGDERRRLTGLVLEQLDGARGGPLSIISIPDHATINAVREATWAVESGARAINLLPPSGLSI